VSLDLDRPCPHADFAVFANVVRLAEREGGPVTAFVAELRVDCAQCGEHFRWIGVPAGHRGDRPMVSVDEFELRAPIRPASSDPDFGLGIPGFAITYREGP